LVIVDLTPASSVMKGLLFVTELMKPISVNDVVRRYTTATHQRMNGPIVIEVTTYHHRFSSAKMILDRARYSRRFVLLAAIASGSGDPSSMPPVRVVERDVCFVGNLVQIRCQTDVDGG
jgi:hypothetical protein